MEPTCRKLVFVGVSGSLPNLAALHTAVAYARHLDAELVAVHAWVPIGGDVAYRQSPCPPLLDLWRRRAQDTLVDAFIDAFGGSPSGVRVRLVMPRGPAGPVLIAAAGKAADLLVLGAGRRGRWTGIQRGPVAGYCASHAACPVLLVPQPDMIGNLPGRPGHQQATPKHPRPADSWPRRGPRISRRPA